MLHFVPPAGLPVAAKNAEQLRVYGQLINRSTPEQHEWIVRIILKDLKGLGEKAVFNNFHWDGKDCWAQCCSLARVRGELLWLLFWGSALHGRVRTCMFDRVPTHRHNGWHHS